MKNILSFVLGGNPGWYPIGILLVGLLTVSRPAFGQASAIRSLPGFTNTVYGANDDGSYPCVGPNDGVPLGCAPTPVPIGFSVNFYGSTFTELYVNNNGNVTFDNPLFEFTPFGLVGVTNEIIAAFFADVDTRQGNVVTFGNDTVDGHVAFGVNWINVGYYNEQTDKLNSFQLVLIDRSDRSPGDFDIEFNYDKVQWETGDAGGGVDGLGGNSAVVGFSNGSGLAGTFFQMAGSGVPGEFLDANPGGLTHGDLNTNVLGRYITPIVNLTNTVLDVKLFGQGDPLWADDAYNNSTYTIQEKGCALSVLAMALDYAGVVTDPGSLNTLLTVNGDFIGTAVNWDPATRDASDHVLEFHAHRTSDVNYLSQTLANGYPIIVGVNLNASGAPSHFVLVIGEQNGHFLINDPGHAGNTSLDAYNNAFETRGYVGDPSGDVSGLDVSVDDPADLLLIDSTGRRTGYSPILSGILEEIPQAVHFSDSIEASDLTGAPGDDTAHSVIIFQPPQQTFQLYLFGNSSTNYNLNVRSFSQTGTSESPVTLQNPITPAGIAAFLIELGAGGAVLSPSLAASNFTSLYSFTGLDDGANPNPGLLQGVDGALYGTAQQAGANDAGTVFRITTNGALSTVYDFGSVTDTNGDVLDGETPNGGLEAGVGGNFYGTAQSGGVNGYGTVFELTAQGSLPFIYAFGSVTDANGDLLDGSVPNGNLVPGVDGNIYGTAQMGGVNGLGTVFQVTPNGTLNTIYQFGSVTDQNGNILDGETPNGGLVQARDGGFYGTTQSGGPNLDQNGDGYGTIFRVTSAGALSTLYSFGTLTNPSGKPIDGANPLAGLVLGSDGNLYGTAEHGGVNGTGTVFSITTNGLLTVLYSFTGWADGANPTGGLIRGSDGNFYGTTAGGGTLGGGTIFRVSSGGALTTLYSFLGAADGAYPADGLLQAADGYLYGTTPRAGIYTDGTAFRLNISATPTFIIQQVAVSGGMLSFTWNAVAGKTYQVEYTSSLSPAAWKPLGAPIIANSATATDSDVVAASHTRFYRIVMLP